MEISLPRNNSNLVASFDFDDTLTRPEFDVKTGRWHATKEPNPFVVAEMFRLASMGWKTYIITERHKTPVSLRMVNFFCSKHTLPFSGVVYTAGSDKIDFIRSLQSILHYDDDLEEIALLAAHDISGVLVRHPDDAMTKEELQKHLVACGLMEGD